MKTPYLLRLPEDLKKMAVDRADELCVSLNALIIQALRQYVETKAYKRGA